MKSEITSISKLLWITYFGVPFKIRKESSKLKDNVNKSFSPRNNNTRISIKAPDTKKSQEDKNKDRLQDLAVEELKIEEQGGENKLRYNKMAFTNQNYLSKLIKIFDVYDAYNVKLTLVFILYRIFALKKTQRW